MNPIPTTPTRPASDSMNMTKITEIEVLLQIIESKASIITASIESFALGILMGTCYTEKDYPKDGIKFLAKEIGTLSLEHRKNGNILYDWDNRFNNISKPEGCCMRRITLRTRAQPKLIRSESPLIRPPHLENVAPFLEEAPLVDFQNEIIKHQKRTPPNSNGI